MRLSRWLSSMLAIGAIAGGLLAWQRQAGEETDAPAAPPAAAPPLSAPARMPAQAPARPRAWPAIADEAPLDVQVERLLASHDPADAYRAYWLVADCAAFNLNHDRIIFDRGELEHPKPGTLPGFRTMTEDEKRHDATFCGALTERERQSRLDYLALAAKAGVPGAAFNFANEGPFGDPGALQTRPGDPLVQAWKATASAQLTRAAESGADFSALQYLADQYANGSALTDKNPLLAYRYLVAMNLINEEMIGPGDPMSISLASQREGFAGMVQDYSAEQGAAELAAARHIADLARAQREQARGQAAPGA